MPGTIVSKLCRHLLGLWENVYKKGALTNEADKDTRRQKKAEFDRHMQTEKEVV